MSKYKVARYKIAKVLGVSDVSLKAMLEGKNVRLESAEKVQHWLVLHKCMKEINVKNKTKFSKNGGIGVKKVLVCAKLTLLAQKAGDCCRQQSFVSKSKSKG